MINHKVMGLFVFLALTTFSLFGCGDVNEEGAASVYPHPTGWVAASESTHPAAFHKNQDICIECHGTDLGDPAGGISKVSCSSCHQWPYGHPAGWSDPASHGSAAKAAAPGLASCKNCHASDFTGGTSGQSCMTCHSTAPHPPRPWFGNPNTHSNTDTSNAATCATCHAGRANLSPTGAGRLPATAIIGTTGCYNNTLCHGVMGHSSDPQPWSAAANHGAKAKLNPGSGNGFSTCQQCHGTAFNTDRGGSNCFSCHTTAPHPVAANWREIGTITHTTTGLNNATVCTGCHTSATPNLATPYSAWFSNAPAGSFKTGSPGCFTASLCHGDVRKTSNCDACHSIATTSPFKSLSGATATSNAKVGVHVKHLSAAALTSNIACSECHSVPTSPAVSGTHRNDINNITFGTLARTDSLTPPSYTAATGVCANTYCHGATLSGGTNKAPVWNQTNYNTGCGTCHGFPPPAPHSTNSDCNNCHSNVNATNNGFITASQHINGIVEVSAGASHAFPYPGSAHRTATPSTCQGCHNITSTTGTYPVPRGTAPNCAGCHISSLFAGCSDCHGNASTGRPDGTPNAFPNRARLHSSPGDHAVACAVCHAGGGSGVSTHGNSNGVVKTATNVIVRFSATGTVASDSNMIITRSGTTVTCTNTCHITGGRSENHNDSW